MFMMENPFYQWIICDTNGGLVMCGCPPLLGKTIFLRLWGTNWTRNGDHGLEQSHLEVSINGGYPNNGWFIMEIPSQKWMIKEHPHLFKPTIKLIHYGMVKLRKTGHQMFFFLWGVLYGIVLATLLHTGGYISNVMTSFDCPRSTIIS